MAGIDIQKVCDELEGMSVLLDHDPIQYGPKRLQEKIATTRNFLTRLEQIYLVVFRQLKNTERNLLVEQQAFEIEKNRLLAEDPEVRAEKNIRDREAVCHRKLREQVDRIHGLEIQVANFKALIDILKTKRTDLKDVGSKLRDQMKLVHDEISLGGRWGFEDSPDIQLKPGQGVSENPTIKLDSVLDAVGGEIHLGVAEGLDDDDKPSSIDDILNSL